MSYKEVKELLNTYLKKLKLVNTYKELIKQAKEDALCLKAVEYENEKVNTSISSSAQERALERLSALEETYERLFNELFKLEENIAIMLTKLDETEQGLIIDRYMKGEKLFKISNKYYFSYDGMRNKYRKIYKKLSK